MVGLVLFFIFAGVDESSSLSFSWLRNFWFPSALLSPPAIPPRLDLKLDES
jgi:hypothetical protein